MLFMVTHKWPSKSNSEVSKRFVEAMSKPNPPYVESAIYLTTGKDGMKSYIIQEVEEGHEAEGLNEVIRLYAPYFNIEGWSFTVEPLLPVRDALLLIGQAI